MIGDNVRLGAGVIVLAGVEIGANTAVDAGSVVTKSLPANCVAYGNPCRVVRDLSAEVGRSGTGSSTARVELDFGPRSGPK